MIPLVLSDPTRVPSVTTGHVTSSEVCEKSTASLSLGSKARMPPYRQPKFLKLDRSDDGEGLLPAFFEGES